MGAITRLIFPQQFGNSMLIIPRAHYINAMVLAAGVAETFTIPTDCTYLFMTATANFYARFSGTPAAVPSTEIADGTGSALNPTARHVGGLTSISFIAPTDCTITIECFKGK